MINKTVNYNSRRTSMKFENSFKPRPFKQGPKGICPSGPRSLKLHSRFCMEFTGEY
jgi:hypothetical protein